MAKMTRQTDAKITAPPLHMPNATSTAEDVMNRALEFCARKMRAEGRQAAINRLQQGNHCAYEYCYYSIAEQVGAALGALDENVKAIYMFEYEATPEDLCFSETKNAPLLHLLVWTQRKTEALNALVAMLDRALVRIFAQLIGPRQLKHLLDVQIIDDADVEGRTGYGAMLHSLHHRPLKVWEH
jgi:hypothetical protein